MTLNVIVPVFNEEGSLKKLYSEIAAVVSTLDLEWYITFVNDGSSDNSQQVLTDLQREYDHIHVVALSRNFGKEIALSAGLDANEADVVIMMDSDLQHPPEYIPQFLEKWRNGAQVVIGVRTKEGTENRLKVVGSKLFYWLMNKVSQVQIVPRATDFRLLDKEVVDVFRTMPEHNRITRGMIDWLGYQRDYVKFAAAVRHSGVATYNTRKLFKLAFDSFVSMTLLPLRVSIYLGISILAVFGPLGLFMLISKYLLDDRFDFSGPATLAVLIILLVGVILVNIGFVGIYIANIQDQVRGRPLYVVNKKLSSLRGSRRRDSGSDVSSVAEVLHDLDLSGVQSPEASDQVVPEDTPAQKQRFVWLSWKDIRHAHAGGAELVQHHICRRLVADGHQVVVVTSRPKGTSATEVIDGYRVDRKGNRYTVYWHAWRRYRKQYRDAADIVVEEINTVGFFSRWYIGKRARSVLLFHQLAREIWFYEYFPPLNFMGYLLEPLSLRFINRQRKNRQPGDAVTPSSLEPDAVRSGVTQRGVSTYGEASNAPNKPHMAKKAAGSLALQENRQPGDDCVIAMSRSTRLDLIKNSFDPNTINIISEGNSIDPVIDPTTVEKLPVPSILAYGSIRGMKRTTHILKAYEIAKESLPTLVLTIAGGGEGEYARHLKRAVKTSPHYQDITLTGRVSEQDKAGLLGSHHFLVSTAVKEGWGLTITEAAGQGTPAIAYNVDGQRDAVFFGRAGILVEPDIEQLADAIIAAFDPEFNYAKLQRDAWLHAQSITFDNSYQDFLATLQLGP